MLTCRPHCFNVYKLTSLGEGPQKKAVIGDPASVQDGTRTVHVSLALMES